MSTSPAYDLMYQNHADADAEVQRLRASLKRIERERLTAQASNGQIAIQAAEAVHNGKPLPSKALNDARNRIADLDEAIRGFGPLLVAAHDRALNTLASSKLAEAEQRITEAHEHRERFEGLRLNKIQPTIPTSGWGPGFDASFFREQEMRAAELAEGGCLRHAMQLRDEASRAQSNLGKVAGASSFSRSEPDPH
jgi:hypothetical protein